MKNWLGTFGFSYVGLIFLFLLFMPNIAWSKHKPKGYTADGERKVLRVFEAVGQAAVTCIALCFSDFNLRPISWRSLFLAAACLCMLLYAVWWVRYFQSEKKLPDFYRSLCGIPVAGATLPVFAFFFLGIYGQNLWMLAACICLGVGHIGIHLQHKKDLQANADTTTEA